MVADAPRFSEVGRAFLEFAAESTLVAHNAYFDLGFLQESLARTGLPLWKGKTLDSLRIVRKTHPGLPSYSLQSLRAHYQLTDGKAMQAPRAAADAEWTRQLPEIVLTEALRRTLQPPAGG